MKNKFFKYVSQNIFAMVGLSCYIIADTFFISKAAGTDGITILNFALPVYGILFAIGSMIGVGSATRYAIAKARHDEDMNSYFSNALFFAFIIGAVFSVIGITHPETVMRLMGADGGIITKGKGYNRIFLAFAPAFMMNYSFTNFIRNDNDTGLAMIATISSSLANIVLDYTFMFPLNMGIEGAALATAISPIISMAICSIHFFKKKNTVKFKWHMPSFKRLFKSMELGVSAFVAEISSAVTTTVFNFLLLRLIGNIGVAAYGVIANLSFVAVAIFNGTAQGVQPLLSDAYGRGDKKEISQLLKHALITVLSLAAVIVLASFLFTDGMVAIFNSENSKELAKYAYVGLRIYFSGFIFASFNIVASAYFGATEQVGPGAAISVMRGFFVNIICAVLLSNILGVNGVWMSFMTAECITAIAAAILIVRKKKNERDRNLLQ